jgi:protein gp37
MGWSKLPWTAQNAAENVQLHEKRLTEPLRWKTPRRVFVNSMSDLFHEQTPDDFIDKVFAVMAKADRHTFQILTKRPERMREYAKTWGVPPMPNIWLGTSVEDYRRWQERSGPLRETLAAVRFVSFEPWLADMCVLGDLSWLDWAIIGGESGPDHRPMNLASAESLTDQLTTFGVPVFWKQDSGARPGKRGRLSDTLWNRKEYPASVSV